MKTRQKVETVIKPAEKNNSDIKTPVSSNMYLNRRMLIRKLDEMRASTPQKDWAINLVQILKQTLETSQATIRKEFENERYGGHKAAEKLSRSTDQIIRTLCEFITTFCHTNPNPTQAEALCLVATGGYGRGELAPYSDIDLLFLIPHKPTPWAESVIETCLYSLWDLGFKVGHSVRSMKEALHQIDKDIVARTALLDSRYLWGDAELYRGLVKTFKDRLITRTGPEYVEKKLAERDDRHLKLGDTRYLVEPNLKEGKGGLRDLQTMWWIVRYLHFENDRMSVVRQGLLQLNEFKQFEHAENFLWSVRFALHYLTGRAEERLTFDYQRELAAALRYKDRPGVSAVERFMKHYFYIAKQVGDLTRIFCAVLEDRHQKKSIMERISIPVRTSGYKRLGGRLTVSDLSIFQTDPIAMLRIFMLADKYDLDIHPQALKAISTSLHHIDDSLRNSAPANAIFMATLCDSKNRERTLTRMNEAGVFGRFIPDFGRIVAQMQFDMYHHFTVDNHTIKAIAAVDALERGDLAQDHPYASALINKIAARRVLYVALLLHDIAKGRRGDHSIVGAEIALELCPRLGLSSSQTETVSWLIRWHLLMSNTAFKRDINDAKTIEDFCRKVKSPERLKLLWLLTIADIRAVGPGVWNGWKGQLLRELYTSAEENLIAGHSTLMRAERVASKQTTLATRLKKIRSFVPEQYFSKWRQSYWIAEDDETLIANARLFIKAKEKSKSTAIDIRTDRFQEITKVSVYTKDRLGLFSHLLGALTACNVQIKDAKIHTSSEGTVMDNFSIQTYDGAALVDKKLIQKLKQILENAAEGHKQDRGAMSIPRIFDRKRGSFNVKSTISIDNKASSQATVIEVGAKDRPGLLYDLATALYRLKINVVSAHIATYGEKAVDVFYVLEKDGKKAEHKIRRRNIEQKLLAAADGK